MLSTASVQLGWNKILSILSTLFQFWQDDILFFIPISVFSGGNGRSARWLGNYIGPLLHSSFHFSFFFFFLLLRCRSVIKSDFVFNCRILLETFLIVTSASYCYLFCGLEYFWISLEGFKFFGYGFVSILSFLLYVYLIINQLYFKIKKYLLQYFFVIIFFKQYNNHKLNLRTNPKTAKYLKYKYIYLPSTDKLQLILN